MMRCTQESGQAHRKTTITVDTTTAEKALTKIIIKTNPTGESQEIDTFQRGPTDQKKCNWMPPNKEERLPNRKATSPKNLTKPSAMSATRKDTLQEIAFSERIAKCKKKPNLTIKERASNPNEISG